MKKKTQGKKLPKKKAAKSASRTVSKKPASKARLRLLERRRHPRFLLTREQFREVKTGRIFPVYDLSASGMSIRIEDQFWKPGTIVQGILNLHPDSIELSPRLLSYYGDRAALQFEALSTYGRGVLARALSPRRLGATLQLVREKLPVADFWFNGVCNTDLLVKLDSAGAVSRFEVFFSNSYCAWADAGAVPGGGTERKFATGYCQSCGREKREDMLLSVEPVKLESIDIAFDAEPDLDKLRWARGIIDASVLDPKLKSELLKKFDLLGNLQ